MTQVVSPKPLLDTEESMVLGFGEGKKASRVVGFRQCAQEKLKFCIAILYLLLTCELC